jgi:cobalt-zinc-cadmium efflux system membrane fusion protein
MKLLKILSILFLIFILSCNSSEEKETTNTTETRVNADNAKAWLNNEAVSFGIIDKRTVARKVKCTGEILVPPTHRYAVHGRHEGRVSGLRFGPGDYVKRGSRLVSISHPDLLQMQSALLETKARLDFSSSDMQRKKRLREGKAVPEKVYEEVVRDHAILSAKYAGIKSELEMVGIDTEKLQADKKFQNSVHIYAPFDAYVHELYVAPGQYVTEENLILDLVALGKAKLKLNILTKDVPYVKKSQELHFSLSGQDELYHARIEALSPVMNEMQSALEVYANIITGDYSSFKQGMYVNAEIAIDSVEIYGLNRDAVVLEGQSYFAFRLNDDSLEKVELNDVVMHEDFVEFSNDREGQWCVQGAYYIE